MLLPLILAIFWAFPHCPTHTHKHTHHNNSQVTTLDDDGDGGGEDTGGETGRIPPKPSAPGQP